MRRMNTTKLIGKITADTENKKLGRISSIENLLGKTKKENIPHAMIVVNKFLQKTIVVPLDVKKVTKVEGDYVWFSITKAEFTAEEKEIRKLKTLREIQPGTYAPSDRRAFQYGMDHSRLSRKKKERKK